MNKRVKDPILFLSFYILHSVFQAAETETGIGNGIICVGRIKNNLWKIWDWVQVVERTTAWFGLGLGFFVKWVALRGFNIMKKLTEVEENSHAYTICFLTGNKNSESSQTR